MPSPKVGTGAGTGGTTYSYKVRAGVFDADSSGVSARATTPAPEIGLIQPGDNCFARLFYAIALNGFCQKRDSK